MPREGWRGLGRARVGQGGMRGKVTGLVSVCDVFIGPVLRTKESVCE